MKIISIIGIGEVGASVANLLLPFPNIQINLLDIGEVDGRVLDLQHGAAVYNKYILFNDQEVLQESDIIIYTAGYCNKANESRNSVAGKNKELVQQIFTPLKLKSDTIIIAISNPVELISTWISEIFNHRITVVGTGTSLDTFRLKYLLQKNTKQGLDKIQTLVVGEHGQNMVPVWSHTFINDEKYDIEQHPESTNHIIEELLQSAKQIRTTEKATKFGVAQCTAFICQNILYNEGDIIPLSVLINNESKHLLKVKENIFISLPCRFDYGKLVVEKSYQYNETELNQLRAAALSIQNVYQSLSDVTI